MKEFNIYKSIRKRYYIIKTKIYLWFNRLHFSIEFQKTSKFFKIIINEKYKKYISIVKYLITFIGLFSSLLIFPSVFYSFVFALVLYIFQSFIELFIFSYKVIYIQPLPNFEINNKKWLGMCFGYAQNPQVPTDIPYIGMLFSDEKYAKNVFNLISSWNYGNQDDSNNNIITSVIIRDNNEYTFFIYPSNERDTIKNFFKSNEEERKKTSLTDVQQKMFIQIIFGKTCKITDSSYFPTFIERYRDGVPYYFEALIFNNNNEPISISGLNPIIVHNLKIKNETDLTRIDMEYEILKLKNRKDKD